MFFAIDEFGDFPIITILLIVLSNIELSLSILLAIVCR